MITYQGIFENNYGYCFLPPSQEAVDFAKVETGNQTQGNRNNYTYTLKISTTSTVITAIADNPYSYSTGDTSFDLIFSIKAIALIYS